MKKYFDFAINGLVSIIALGIAVETSKKSIKAAKEFIKIIS